MELEAQLREQALLHGLVKYTAPDEPSEHVDLKEAREIEDEVKYDAELMGSFAGMRKKDVRARTYEFVPGEELEDGSQEPGESIINVNEFKSPKELEDLGLESLKEQLVVRGMKCGGTLEERAKRLFQCKGVKDLSKLDPKLLAKRKVAVVDEEEAKREHKRYKKQQGPILEHQWMRRNQKKLPSSWR